MGMQEWFGKDNSVSYQQQRQFLVLKTQAQRIVFTTICFEH